MAAQPKKSRTDVIVKMAPCLWFDGTAEQATNFYASALPDGLIDVVSR